MSEDTSNLLEELESELRPLLINSDGYECNKNLSVFLKRVVDFLSNEDEVYHSSLVLALRLLSLNLFIKNFALCVGKILSLLSVLAETDEDHLKVFLLIILLLLLKLKDDDDDTFDTLRQLGFVQITGDFIVGSMLDSETDHSSYVLLKLNCDVIFQYLFHVVLLSDAEFQALTESPLIPTLIDDLLSSEAFDKYDLTGDDFTEDKLIAYEKLKLLLLINEQYLMKSMYGLGIQNKVFEGLLSRRKDAINGICGFTNLLVYQVNREESSIIKILMLKFLYLIFTSSSTARLPYLNDLKILIDIVVRELNDLDYSEDENRILALTYLKVLFPLLLFSQLSDLQPAYKGAEIVEMLRSIVTNCDTRDTSQRSKELSDIVKSAIKCLTIPWVKKCKAVAYSSVPGRLTKHANGSTESVSSASLLNSKASLARGDAEPASSSESLAFTRVASVRAFSKNDYHKSTTSHNLELVPSQEESPNLFEANNHNVFMSPVTSPGALDLPRKHTAKLLDLPKEYLQKKALPQLPHLPRINCLSLLEKARKKKAPPPPPPPPRKRR